MDTNKIKELFSFPFWILIPFLTYGLLIFPHSVDFLFFLLVFFVCLFVFFFFFFCYAEAFEFDVVAFVDYCFCCVVGTLSRKSLPRLILISFFAMLYSDSFMVSGFMFKPLMHFKLIFMSCVR